MRSGRLLFRSGRARAIVRPVRRSRCRRLFCARINAITQVQPIDVDVCKAGDVSLVQLARDPPRQRLPDGGSIHASRSARASKMSRLGTARRAIRAEQVRGSAGKMPDATRMEVCRQSAADASGTAATAMPATRSVRNRRRSRTAAPPAVATVILRDNAIATWSASAYTIQRPLLHHRRRVGGRLDATTSEALSSRLSGK